MELELLGTRLLVPYFGSSVYVVMGSVIGVFLLSLSVGYVLGGWLSRMETSGLILGADLAVAGAWICLVPLVVEPVCNRIMDVTLDERRGALAAAFVLFGLPTVILGTVSPTAVRWLTREAKNSGFKAGLVLGCSTVASFAGTLVTAFYLVLLSARRTLFVSGAILVAAGVAILVDALVRRKRGPT